MKPFQLWRRKVFTMNIYIGNLSHGTTENSLKALFGQYGEIESVKVIKDRFSGRPKGYGFIEMPNDSEADQAIKAAVQNLFLQILQEAVRTLMANALFISCHSK